MTRPSANNLDFLAACLHGRRSRMAEGERLDGLCRLRTVPDLMRAVLPEGQFSAGGEFQRKLAADLAVELSAFAGHLDVAGADLLAWMLARFQVENIKVLLRGMLNRVPIETLREHLLPLAAGLELDPAALAAAESPEAFAELLPLGAPRQELRKAVAIYRDPPRPFFFEAALDRGYFQELLARVERIRGEDRELIKPLLFQEVDVFHLMLVVRGRFHYGLTPELLLPLHVRGSAVPSERFRAMLGDAGPLAAAGRIVGRVLDELPTERSSRETSAPVDPAVLEALAWKRYLRLARRAFRQSHMGLAAVVGYAGIRRIEVANLITLSEGIRTGMAADVIRGRLIPRTELEAVYV